MKLSEYIKLLREIEKEEGDLEVYSYTSRGVTKASDPECKHLKILSKKESRQEYWEKWRSVCTPENKGDKVVAI